MPAANNSAAARRSGRSLQPFSLLIRLAAFHKSAIVPLELLSTSKDTRSGSFLNVC